MGASHVSDEWLPAILLESLITVSYSTCNFIPERHSVHVIEMFHLAGASR